MPRFTLSTLLAAAVISSRVYAQNSTDALPSSPIPSSTPLPIPSSTPESIPSSTTTTLIPLASKHFDYSNLPYQADPDIGIRGNQTGYNRCNSTTENQKSFCQTAIINSIEDFCLWAPPDGPQTIGESEHGEVAWCTKSGYGARKIPAGALKGVQFMKTPDYIQIVGFIDQTFINIPADDYGGELDPHGADFRGNPLGGLLFSNAWSTSKSDFKQVIEWHNFMGGNAFCFKACDPAGPNAARYCEHIFDRIGCAYNAPNNAKNGTFETCDGDNQDFPGVYTDSTGQVQTYTQPPESLGAISPTPYTVKVPASSNCVTHTSSLIYTDLPTVTPSSPTGQSSVRSTGSRTSTGAGPTNTGSSSGSNGSSGSPTGLALSSLTSLLGVALAVFFLS